MTDSLRGDAILPQFSRAHKWEVVQGRASGRGRSYAGCSPEGLRADVAAVAQTIDLHIIIVLAEPKGDCSLIHLKIVTLLAALLLGSTLALGCESVPAESPSPVPTTPVPPPSPHVQIEEIVSTPSPSLALPTSVPSLPTPLPLASPSAQGAAIVNGQPIPLDDFEAQVEIAKRYVVQGPGDAEEQITLAELRRQVLDWMIDQVLIEQAAIREGTVVTDDQVEAEIARMRSSDEGKFNEWLLANGLTVESLRARLRSEMLGAALAERLASDVPSRVEQVHLRHILTSTQAEAEEVLRRLKGGEDFAALARVFSLDQTTRETGGDLGFLPRGIMSPEFDAVAFALAVGDTSGVVRSQYGYHVVQMVEKDPAREVPAELMPALQQHVFQQWLEGERAGASIMKLVQ